MDFYLNETWDEGLKHELHEASLELHKKYPVSGLQITDRRKLQRFARDHAAGLAPSVPVACSHCEAETSQKGCWCSNFCKPAFPKTEDRTTEGELRESHATAPARSK